MDSMDTSENNHQHESVASLAKRFEKLAEDLGAQNNVNGFVDNGLCQSKTNQGTKSPTVQNQPVRRRSYRSSTTAIASREEIPQKPLPKPRPRKSPPNIKQKATEKKEGLGTNSEQETQALIQRLRQENTDKDNEIQQLRQEIFNKINEILQLREENISMNREKQQVQQENDDLRIEIQHLQETTIQENFNKNEIQQLGRRKSKRRNEMYVSRQENVNKNNQNQQLVNQQEIVNTNNEIQRLRGENLNINNEILELRRENANMSRRNQKVQKENDDLRIEIEKRKEDTIFSFCEGRGSVIVSKEVLGKGGWGTVYMGDFYGTKVAVKEFHDIILSPHNEEILGREIKIASQCRHPNLLQFICATENDQHHLLIVTELMDMTLRTLLEQCAREKSQMEYQEIKSISLDLARGLNYLHSKKPNPVIHRDVSSANVLLWIENGAVRRAKISDYGSANFMQNCKTANPGAALYAAPEASRTEHDAKIDIFSYGLLVCEMSICKLPHFDQVERNSQIQRIPNVGVRELVKCCIVLDPQKRPTMQGVIGFWQCME